MTHSLPTVDVRCVPGEVRMTTSSAGKRVVSGYAAVFNSRSQVLYTEAGDPFVETIAPGAFKKSLLEADVRGLFNHESNKILGRRGAGTLRLAEDSTGLHYEINLGTRSYDKDLEESLDRKDIIGSSFAFATIEDAWSDDNAMVLRQLRCAHLFDVGPVTYPAYLAATATCRAYSVFVEKRSALAVPPPPTVVYPTPEQIASLNAFKLSLFN